MYYYIASTEVMEIEYLGTQIFHMFSIMLTEPEKWGILRVLIEENSLDFETSRDLLRSKSTSGVELDVLLLGSGSECVE